MTVGHYVCEVTVGHCVREVTVGHCVHEVTVWTLGPRGDIWTLCPRDNIWTLGPHDTLTLGQKGFIWKSRSNLSTKTHGYLLLKSNHIVSLKLLYYDFSRGLN